MVVKGSAHVPLLSFAYIVKHEISYFENIYRKRSVCVFVLDVATNTTAAGRFWSTHFSVCPSVSVRFWSKHPDVVWFGIWQQVSKNLETCSTLDVTQFVSDKPTCVSTEVTFQCLPRVDRPTRESENKLKRTES